MSGEHDHYHSTWHEPAPAWKDSDSQSSPTWPEFFKSVWLTIFVLGLIAALWLMGYFARGKP